MQTPLVKRSPAQNKGFSHSACKIGSAEAIDAMAAKARMCPTRRMMAGHA